MLFPPVQMQARTGPLLFVHFSWASTISILFDDAVLYFCDSDLLLSAFIPEVIHYICDSLVIIEITAFWDVMSCGLVDRYTNS
jgi:hypothetical protein